jgi:hypothetical protein
MCLETLAALELHLGLATEAESNLRGQSASVAVAATDDSAPPTHAYDLYIYEPDTHSAETTPSKHACRKNIQEADVFV